MKTVNGWLHFQKSIYKTGITIHDICGHLRNLRAILHKSSPQITLICADLVRNIN